MFDYGYEDNPNGDEKKEARKEVLRELIKSMYGKMMEMGEEPEPETEAGMDMKEEAGMEGEPMEREMAEEGMGEEPMPEEGMEGEDEEYMSGLKDYLANKKDKKKPAASLTVVMGMGPKKKGK